MSLIEEALRRVKDPLVHPAATKAEKPRTAAPSQARPTAHSWSTTPAPSPSQPAAASPITPLALATLAVLGLTVALLVGGAAWIWRTFKGRAPVATTPMSPGVAPEPATAAMSETTTPSKPAVPSRSATAATDPEFHLTGVVEGSGDPYAVINGSIVGVGETVGTATLLGIAEGIVTLRLADGKDTVLRVER